MHGDHLQTDTAKPALLRHLDLPARHAQKSFLSKERTFAGTVRSGMAGPGALRPHGVKHNPSSHPLFLLPEKCCCAAQGVWERRYVPVVQLIARPSAAGCTASACPEDALIPVFTSAWIKHSSTESNGAYLQRGSSQPLKGYVFEQLSLVQKAQGKTWDHGY